MADCQERFVAGGAQSAALMPLRFNVRFLAVTLFLGFLVACTPWPSQAQPSPEQTLPIETLTNNLLALSRKYQAAGPPLRPALLSELQSVAATRRERLLALMQTDPAAVLRFAIPASVRAGVPPDVQADVEQEVEIEGTLLVLHVDRNRGSRYLYFLDAGAQRFSLHFGADQPALLTGARVRVRGLRVGEALVLASGKSDLKVL